MYGIIIIAIVPTPTPTPNTHASYVENGSESESCN